MNRYFIHLAEKRACEKKLTGGKGANLAKLYQLGFNVPFAFILSSRVFKKMIKNTEGEQFFTLQKLPEKVKSDLKILFNKIDGPLAVRSSVVGEDSCDASHAGQLDSFLHITNYEQLITAVLKCYSGILNQRFVTYRKKWDKSEKLKYLSSLSMAVIIQKMISAKTAGVAFSANPMTGHPCIIIEATVGLGEKLAAGHINPDRYLLYPELTLIEQHLVDPSKPVLTPSQIEELGKIVKKISALLNKPQDVEWAWDGSTFHILQSRPITAVTGKPVYSNRLVSDMTPGLIKDLVWSTNLLDMTTNVFGRIFTYVYGPNQIDFHDLIKKINSRVYINITFLADVFEKIGLPINYFDSLLRDEKPIIRYPVFSPRVVKTSLRFILFLTQHSMIKNRLQNFIHYHDARLNEFRKQEWKNFNYDSLLQRIQRLRKYHRKTQWYMWIGAMNMTIRNRLLKKYVNRFVPEVNPDNLISGLIGLKSLEPNQKIYELANLARRLDLTSLSDSFASFTDHLQQSLEGQTFLKKFYEFLDHYGHLSMNGTDFSMTPWIENPMTILQAISRQLESPAPIGKSLKAAERERATLKVRQKLTFWRRYIFNGLLHSTIAYLKLREKLSLFMSEDSYQMRRIYLTLGDQLVKQNVLQNRDDIFHLSFSELKELVTRKSRNFDYKKIVEQRKLKIAADAVITPSEVICEDEISLIQRENKEWLQGISGSAGWVRGYARVISDPSDVRVHLSRKDILIVPFTDVGWTPLFPSIGGIVAETGGQLSHSAIIAREYGLPAVLSVKNATKLIKEGQKLTIDGNTGRVYLTHLDIAEKNHE